MRAIALRVASEDQGASLPFRFVRLNMTCETADRLRKFWHRAAVRYSEVILRMVQIPSDLPSASFYDVHTAAERAWLETEKAREALERHRAEHGC